VKVLNTASSGTGRIISASAGRWELFLMVMTSVVTASWSAISTVASTAVTTGGLMSTGTGRPMKRVVGIS
jgi:hypothetical protein